MIKVDVFSKNFMTDICYISIENGLILRSRYVLEIVLTFITVMSFFSLYINIIHVYIELNLLSTCCVSCFF